MQRKNNSSGRSRERERRARKNRKYGQAPLKHAKKGILSCVLAGGVFITLLAMIIGSYSSAGSVAGIVGGLACVAFVFAGCGVYYAIRGFREREKNYVTCKIGMWSNIAFLAGFLAIFLRGLIS